MTPEQERAHEIKRITIMISELIENDQPSEEIARQVIATINRNSLDREEQLMGYIDTVESDLKYFTEKVAEQDKEIQRLEKALNKIERN